MILPGVTRRSVLELVRERLSEQFVGKLAPLQVVERTLTIGEIEKAAQEGRIVESFVSGTAVSNFPPSLLSRVLMLTMSSVLYHPGCDHPQQRHGY